MNVLLPKIEDQVRAAGGDGVTVQDLYDALPQAQHHEVKTAVERLRAQEKILRRRFKGKGRLRWKYYHSQSATASSWQQW